MQDTLTIVLAGGVGSRLSPLTDNRAKPAVPFGGKYRIIDFTLANCLHSGLRQILVLTQYKSHSLQKHLRDGWSVLNPELGEYITNVPHKCEPVIAGTAVLPMQFIKTCIYFRAVKPSMWWCYPVTISIAWITHQCSSSTKERGRPNRGVHGGFD